MSSSDPSPSKSAPVSGAHISEIPDAGIANTINGNRVLRKTPKLFDLAHAAIAKGIPGAWKFLSLLQGSILKDSVAAYQFTGLKPVTLYAPLFRRESSKTYDELERYDALVVDDLVRHLPSGSNAPVWFVDVGADIGLVSSQVIRRVPGLERLFAFEPNDAARPYLEAMLVSAGIDHRVFNAAVAAQSGRGRLQSPSEDPSEHARFIAPDPEGPIAIMAINDLPDPAGKTIILKVDVEGGEEAVIKGALDFLRRADQFIVTFEAHPKVIKRTGHTPDDVLAQLNSIASCSVHLAGDAKVRFQSGKPITEQIPDFENRVHNLICRPI